MKILRYVLHEDVNHLWTSSGYSKDSRIDVPSSENWRDPRFCEILEVDNKEEWWGPTYRIRAVVDGQVYEGWTTASGTTAICIHNMNELFDGRFNTTQPVPDFFEQDKT